MKMLFAIIFIFIAVKNSPLTESGFRPRASNLESPLSNRFPLLRSAFSVHREVDKI